jgi:transketolase
MDGKPNRVYVVVGDGECQEGSIWEAVMSATAFSLDNLTVIVDFNRIQKMDFIERIIGVNRLGTQFESFGWHVKSCDGHNTENIELSLTEQWDAGKPHCLIARTVKGKGLSLMENNPAWHWRMPNKKELKVFRTELDISQDELDAVKETQSCRERI